MDSSLIPGLSGASGSEGGSTPGAGGRVEPSARLQLAPETACNCVETLGPGRVLCGSSEGDVFVWSAHDSEPDASWKIHDGAVYSVACDLAHGRGLSAGTDAVHLFELQSGAKVRSFTAEHDDSGFRIASFDPTGRWVVAESFGNLAYVWDADTGALERTFKVWGYEDAATDVIIGPDRRRLLSVDEGYTMTLWSVETGEDIGQLEGYEHPVSAAAFDPSGRLVASTHEDASLALWDADSGALIAAHRLPVGIEEDELEEEGFRLPAVALGTDARVALVALESGPILVCDPRTGRPGALLVGHAEEARAVIMEADGKVAISGGADGLVAAWQL